MEKQESLLNNTKKRGKKCDNKQKKCTVKGTRERKLLIPTK